MGYDIRRWCLERQNRSAAVNQAVLDYTLSFGSLRTNSLMIFGQRLLFLHAGDDLFFKMGEIPDLFLECILDIFGPVQVQAIDADHVRRSPLRVAFPDRIHERRAEHFARHHDVIGKHSSTVEAGDLVGSIHGRSYFDRSRENVCIPAAIVFNLCE